MAESHFFPIESPSGSFQRRARRLRLGQTTRSLPVRWTSRSIRNPPRAWIDPCPSVLCHDFHAFRAEATRAGIECERRTAHASSACRNLRKMARAVHRGAGARFRRGVKNAQRKSRRCRAASPDDLRPDRPMPSPERILAVCKPLPHFAASEASATVKTTRASGKVAIHSR